MSPVDKPTETERFFGQQELVEDNQQLRQLLRLQEEDAAKYLNAEVAGRVLSIGGMWQYFKRSPRMESFTVLDLSETMVKTYAPPGSDVLIGDLFKIEVPDASYDSIVFSLILHHLADKNWADSCLRIHKALEKARRWLKPGGRIYLLDWCPNPLWQPMQRVMLPITRLFLRVVSGQPLVIMHTRQFYMEALQKQGFRDCRDYRIMPEGVKEWVWYPIFMSIRWLRLPLKIYPKMHILSGLKPV